MEQTYYSKQHIWVKETGETVEIGITEYARDQLDSILFVTLPDVGEKLKIGERFGDIESIKTVSDLISPLDGEVLTVNEALADEPSQLQEDPVHTWIATVRVEKLSAELMDADHYAERKDTL